MDSHRRQFFQYRRQLLKPVPLYIIHRPSNQANYQNQQQQQQQSVSIFSRLKSFISSGCSKLFSYFKSNREQNQGLSPGHSGKTKYLQSRNKLYSELKKYSQANPMVQYEKQLEEQQQYTKRSNQGMMMMRRLQDDDDLMYQHLGPRSRTGFKRPIDRRVGQRERIGRGQPQMIWQEEEEDEDDVDDDKYPASKLSIQVVNQYNKRQIDKAKKVKVRGLRNNNDVRGSGSSSNNRAHRSNAFQTQRTQAHKDTQVRTKRRTTQRSNIPKVTHRRKNKILQQQFTDELEINQPSIPSKIQEFEEPQIKQQDTILVHQNLTEFIKEEKVRKPKQLEIYDQIQEEKEPDQQKLKEPQVGKKSINTNDQQTEKSSSVLSKIDRESITLQHLTEQSNQLIGEKKKKISKPTESKDDPIITEVTEPEGNLQQTTEQPNKQPQNQKQNASGVEKLQSSSSLFQMKEPKNSLFGATTPTTTPSAPISNPFGQSLTSLSSVKKSNNIFAQKKQEEQFTAPAKIEKAPQANVETKQKDQEKKEEVSKSPFSTFSFFKKGPFQSPFGQKTQQKTQQKPQEKTDPKKVFNLFTNPAKNTTTTKDDSKQNLFKISSSPLKSSFDTKIPKPTSSSPLLSGLKTVSPFGKQPDDPDKKPLGSLFSTNANSIFQSKITPPTATTVATNNPFAKKQQEFGTTGGLFQQKNFSPFSNNLFAQGSKQNFNEKRMFSNDTNPDEDYDDLFEDPTKRKRL